MNILICNVGSTSLKYQLFAMEQGEAVLYKGGAERVGQKGSIFYVTDPVTGKKQQSAAEFPTHLQAIEAMLQAIGNTRVDCVGFKVVHAKGVTGTQFLTDDVLKAMEDFNSVAPAHNPPYLAAIRLFRQAMPGTPLIGAFETAFHAQMPPEAALYSIPAELSRKHAIRRYGFHGASHEYLSAYAMENLGKEDCRIISCHLGGSGSICAVKNGISVDTTLGLSLQCGIMHNNRCGDIDPYIIFYLAEECGMSLPEIKEMLQTKSGFLGMSGGLSGDLRDVEEAAMAGNEDCRNAIASYGYSIRKYIGAYTAAMGGLDAIVFGGGIGTNSSTIRALALEGLQCIGVELDKNENLSPDRDDISLPGSKVRIYLVETNEELIVARKAEELLSNT